MWINLKKINIFFLVFLIIAFGALTFFLHGYQQVEKEDAPVYFVDTTEKKVAFSFEILWKEAHLNEVLDRLNNKNVSGTFFITGEWMKRKPDLSKEIIKQGHELGNHSMSHRSFLYLSKEEIYREISSFTLLSQELLDYTPSLFRPPFGEYNRLVLKIANRENYSMVLWSVESMDYTTEDRQALKEQVVENLHPGAIINFKLSSKELPRTLPPLIEKIQSNGYKIVPVSELLKEL